MYIHKDRSGCINLKKKYPEINNKKIEEMAQSNLKMLIKDRVLLDLSPSHVYTIVIKITTFTF